MNRSKLSAILILLLFGILLNRPEKLFSQSLKIEGKPIMDSAFSLALKTINNNIKDSLLLAGADYGGEWTRDCAINAWNGFSLLNPAVAKFSLWSVTIKRDTIGHQYWDKIIWAIGAWNHYLITGDKDFLAQAYKCSKNTMAELESKYFDVKFKLFTGPSHLCDGIAGYPEPPFDPANTSSFVLDHKGADRVKALSTNAIYVEAYRAIAAMGAELKAAKTEIASFNKKSDDLRNTINQLFWIKEKGRYGYFMLDDGKLDTSEESAGIAYALLFNIPDAKMTQELINNTYVSKYGITCVYPHFARYSAEKPGRHNQIVWPLTMGFWADGVLKHGRMNLFQNEMENLVHMALDADKSNGNFNEIYNELTGKPDGGWQCDFHWGSANHQTWSATAFTRMVFLGLAGMDFQKDGIIFKPALPAGYGKMELKGLKYRNMVLNITVEGVGNKVVQFGLNGTKQKSNKVPALLTGVQNIEIKLGK